MIELNKYEVGIITEHTQSEITFYRVLRGSPDHLAYLFELETFAL